MTELEKRKAALKEAFNELNRLANSMRDKSGALTPESRFALAGAQALLTLIEANDETQLEWTHALCLEAIYAKNTYKGLDFQN